MFAKQIKAVIMSVPQSVHVNNSAISTILSAVNGFRCRRCDGTIQEADQAENLMVERVTIQTENTSITPLTQHTSTLQGLKNTIFNNGRYTTNIPTDPHTVTTTDIKTNMLHVHTSIVSRHLATRGNNKILRTPPSHTSSSEERLPRLIRRTLAQLITNKSPFLKSYLHKVDAKTHPSPLCPLCNIHTHDTHHHFNCTRIRTTSSPLDLWTDPAGVTAMLARWTEKLVGGPQTGTSDSPPLARVMGVGRQQHIK